MLRKSSGGAHQDLSNAVDDPYMDAELTPDQAREIHSLRRRFPGAELRVHERPWGVLIEVRRHGHVVTLERLEFATGAVVRDAPIRMAA